MKLITYDDDDHVVFEYDTNDAIYYTSDTGAMLSVEKLLRYARSYMMAMLEYETFDQPESGDYL